MRAVYKLLGWRTSSSEVNHASLVPRPSVATVFDRLQYAKTEPVSTSFCILQAIKNQTHGRPRNEAKPHK